MVSALVNVNKLESQLAQAQNADELRELRAKAKAVEEYLRSQVEPMDAEVRAVAALRLRIDRRLGELLRETVRRHVGRNGLPDGTHSLADLGVSKKQSSLCQMLASVPDDVFERYLATAPRPTLNGVIQAKHVAEADSTPAETGTCTADDLERLIQREVKFRTVSHRLRALRQDRLWSAKDLAERAHVSWQTVLRIEEGVQQPSMRTRRRLLDALGMELACHREVFGELR